MKFEVHIAVWALKNGRGHQSHLENWRTDTSSIDGELEWDLSSWSSYSTGGKIFGFREAAEQLLVAFRIIRSYTYGVYSIQVNTGV